MSSNPEGLSATVLGCAGPRLGAEERAFFARHRPLGFILFARNIENPEQIRALVADLRASVGRASAPVMIDQEGGRVQRLRPPIWHDYPPASRIGDLARISLDDAAVAAYQLSRLMASDLQDLGIDMNCAPVLDVPSEGCHDVIGNRAWGRDPAIVARLGRACANGLADGGVIPIAKHIPGHGRAAVDTHHALPRVTAARADLMARDWAPFRELADLPWAMTAHVIYEAYDSRPATVSRPVVNEVIRGEIGFRGVLITDDLSMNALSGSLSERAGASREAGCDLMLHCNGSLSEMAAVVAGAGTIDDATARRLAAAESWRRAPTPFSVDDALARLASLPLSAAA
ncbi:MAG: beta-N-acetylhexosaminidase [Alphaproteobacteria bacterium]|nr:beta-N-acetylhexosaminidase [Alphaproteobacteria bacterium]